jgi:hypothetical protein
LLVDQHGPKQAARLFAQVLKAVEARGVLVVANEVRAALASGEAIQLAVRAKLSVSATVPTEALPAGLASIEVAAGDVADYVTWLGGVQ